MLVFLYVKKKSVYNGCTDPQKLDQNLTIRRLVFLWQNIVLNSSILLQ